jgi:serine protease
MTLPRTAGSLTQRLMLLLGMGRLFVCVSRFKSMSVRVPALALACMLLLGLPVPVWAAGNAYIVRLRDDVVRLPSAVREQPAAQRERLRAVAQESGVALFAHRPIAHGMHRWQVHAPGGSAAPMGPREADAVLRRLRLHPAVAWAEPDVRLKRLAEPTDPGYVQQWHLKAPGRVTPSAINLPPAWEAMSAWWALTGRASPVVAVLDTGVRFDHPDLAGRLLPGYDLVSEVEYANDGDGRDPDPSDPGDWVSRGDVLGQPAIFQTCDTQDSSWHGTFIAGQLAALAGNGLGGVGVHRDVRVVTIRISGKCGALLSDVFDGLRWAVGLAVDGLPPNPHPARIVNLSFGGDQPCTDSYQSVINELASVGAVLVVAGGNDSAAPLRPADCRGVVSVGAVGMDGLKESYSSVGAALSLMAPGGSIATSTQGLYSTIDGGRTVPVFATYGFRAGTSFSAPLVAGVLSLMLDAHPALPAAELRRRLLAGVRPHVVQTSAPSCRVASTVCVCDTSTCGAGLLDGHLALNQALLPRAVIAVQGTVAPGGRVTVQSTASSTALGRTWSGFQWAQTAGPAGGVLTLATPALPATVLDLPSLAGCYTVSLTVTDSAGASAVTATALPVGVATCPSPPGAETEEATAVVTVPVVPAGGGGGAMPWEWMAALALLMWVLMPKK